MTRGERIKLIKRTAQVLAEMSSTNAGLTLRGFDLNVDGLRGYRDSYDWAVAQLEAASESALGELADDLLGEPAVGTGGVSSIGRPDLWETGVFFRLFISHTSNYRLQAGGLQQVLATWGIGAFVAHADIQPTREWKREIDAALRTCDALCALITPEFVSSEWCDQEVGFAVARGVSIVPLKLGPDPYGFMADIQALTIAEGTVARAVAEQLFGALARNPRTAHAMAPATLRRYEKSGSFEETRTIFPLLRAIPADAWSPTLIEQADRAAKENYQVMDANLTSNGPSVPTAVRELIREAVGEPEPPAADVDDDIPF